MEDEGTTIDFDYGSRPTKVYPVTETELWLLSTPFFGWFYARHIRSETSFNTPTQEP